MQTKHLCVLIHIWTYGEVGTPWYLVKHSRKICFLDSSKAVLILWIIVFLCLVFVMLSRLFIAVLWSPEGKGLSSWLLYVVFIVILLLSHLESCYRCGTWLWRFLILAVFLTSFVKMPHCWESHVTAQMGPRATDTRTQTTTYTHTNAYAHACSEQICKGSYKSDHILLNLLNELRKRDKIRGLLSISYLFHNDLNKHHHPCIVKSKTAKIT